MATDCKFCRVTRILLGITILVIVVVMMGLDQIPGLM